MSYEIYYDRQVIKLEVGGVEHFMIFLVSGSNNCFAILPSGRQAPEKSISAIKRTSYTLEGVDVLGARHLFSRDDIDRLREKLSDPKNNNGVHRTRYATITSAQFATWIANSVKTAVTFKEFKEAGNSVFAYLYKGAAEDDYREDIDTEEQLINALRASSNTDISFCVYGRDLHRVKKDGLDIGNIRRASRRERATGTRESYVIRVGDDYLFSIGSRYMRRSPYFSSAKRYATKASAKHAFLRLLSRFSDRALCLLHVYTNGQVRDITDTIVQAQALFTE